MNLGIECDNHILISVIYLTYGQIETKFYPNKNALEQAKPIRNHAKANKVKTFPSFDAQKLIYEDKLNEGLDIPFRFGKGFDTHITLNDGEWINVEGGRLWSMEFQSKGAYSINFVANQFYIPDSAELYISNASGTMLYGPVTSKENTKNGFLLTDLIQGDDVTIYLFEPQNKIGKSTLTIERVVHAYKNLFPMSYGNLGGSENCNNDIACFPAWDKESDAVALVLLSSGAELCSGSLVMTADQTFNPYFLSAFHCIDTSSPYGSLSTTEISNAENWMFKFQYKMTSCGGSTATTGITYNGAQFRAAWNTSDFVLMEMDNSPLGNICFSWLGWDRSGNTPTSGTGIHHPSGDVMKISFENNQFQTSSWGGINNHWLVSFDDGVVEHGSSGSPILDQNKRVVGQLHGNQNYNGNLSYCSQPRAEYGRFDYSWTGGGTNTTRLSNWLDPCGSGAVTTNTTRSPYISGPSLVCPSSDASFTVDSLPPGATITWQYDTNLLARISAQGSNPCAFVSIGSGNAWVQAVINTGCGQYTTPQAVCSAGAPTIMYISGPTWVQAGSSSNYYHVEKDVWNFGSTYEWSGYGSTTDNWIYISFPEDGHYTLEVAACNCTGCSDPKTLEIDVYNGYRLTFSPNPSTAETTVSVESTSKESIDVSLEWDLEVYDQGRQLKAMKTKLKGKEFKLNTSGWKEGVYVVHAKIKGQTITGKLIVN
jgi:lysyl endopeptidase